MDFKLQRDLRLMAVFHVFQLGFFTTTTCLVRIRLISPVSFTAKDFRELSFVCHVYNEPAQHSVCSFCLFVCLLTGAPSLCQLKSDIHASVAKIPSYPINVCVCVCPAVITVCILLPTIFTNNLDNIGQNITQINNSTTVTLSKIKQLLMMNESSKSVSQV